jgi:threonine/homoserine/homoserine lactone efflux protein
MTDVQFVAFVTASLIIIVVPGVDFALLTRLVIRYGRSAGFTALGGLVVGGTVHATLASLGLSVLLLNSPALYTALRIAGALYLLYLGAMALWATVPRRTTVLVPASAGTSGTAGGTAEDVTETGTTASDDDRDTIRCRAFGMGITSNLLNPKVIVFYVSFVPQFVEPGPGAAARTAFLAATFITLAVLWWIFYIMLIDRLNPWLTRPRVRVAIERLTGLVFILFAVKLALGV